MDWFERITGFKESDYATTQSMLEVSDGDLINKETGRRFGMGRLEVLSLAELRERVEPRPLAKPNPIREVRGDVRTLHLEPQYKGALFQVASQFNLLEMVGPSITPEDGVTRYAYDRTQGPACAMAAGAATIYRNYLVEVNGCRGQTAKRQLNTLSDLGRALSHTDKSPLWDWHNGYVLCSASGLKRIGEQLADSTDAQLGVLRGLVKIGLHWDVEVTDASSSPGPRVSQAFCSALPVAYGRPPASAWAGFAKLVLEAAYEATLLAAALNAKGSSSNTVLLTRLGGGAFGNDASWIDQAIKKSTELTSGLDLNVTLVGR